MDLPDLLRELICIRSDNPPGDTNEVIEYIRDFLSDAGIEGEIVRAHGNRCNFVHVSEGNELLLCGHVDVVPAMNEGWSCDPYAGVIKEGFIWGRGASDMKGGCAAILWALKSLKEEGVEPRTNIAFVCDEETGGRCGIRYLLKSGLLPKTDCIIAEPTPPLHPNIGQKGLIRVDLDFTGEPCHASLHPYVGHSAICEALRFLSRLEGFRTAEVTPPPHLIGILQRSAEVLKGVLGMPDAEKVLKTVTYNPGVIRGGEKVNIVAQRCHLELDMRIPWGISSGEVLRSILDLAPSASVRIRDFSEPNCTSPAERVVKYLSDEINLVTGRRVVPILQWAASDAKYLRDEGFPVVEYGPGEIPLLHAVNERVSIQSLELASRVFRRMIQRYSNDTATDR